MVALLNQNNRDEIIELLHQLQKQMKYGLSSTTEISLFELGFSNRCLVNELVSITGKTLSDEYELIKTIRRNVDKMNAVLNQHPSHFTIILNNPVA